MTSTTPTAREPRPPRYWHVYANGDRYIDTIIAANHAAAMDIVAERWGGACGYSAVLAPTY